MAFQAYQANWSWDKHTDIWLKKMCIGRTLNFPCGMSNIGDCRADLDINTNPDTIADLNEPFKTFNRFSFDTVICDPPFSMFNKHRWYMRLPDLARKRVIFSAPAFAIKLKKSTWKKTWYVTENSGRFFARYWQVFDRIVLGLNQ